ncbi:MAG: envelope stress response membrane protein PspB [Novosphingobium sp.]
MEILIPISMTFLALIWVILHYVTKWKTSPSLTQDDEVMLEELYQVARRLDERMDTVERLLAADNPDFRPGRLRADLTADTQALDELDRMRQSKERNLR